MSDFRIPSSQGSRCSSAPDWRDDVRSRERHPARTAIARPGSYSERGCGGGRPDRWGRDHLPRGNGDGAASTGQGAAYAMAGALQPFGSCDNVLKYFKDQAPEYLIQRAGGIVASRTTDAAPPGAERAAPKAGRAADSSGTTLSRVARRPSTRTNERPRGRRRRAGHREDGRQAHCCGCAGSGALGCGQRRRNESAQHSAGHDGSQRVSSR